MSNEKYTIKELSLDEMLDDLNGTSPLNMSKKLMEYELFDQQSSLEVLEQIYEEFESKEDIVDELVTPVFFNIADGLVKHPKLGLQKTGITASRLVNEIKNFSYDQKHDSERDMFQDKKNLDENTKANTVTHTDKDGKVQDSRYYARDKETAKKQGKEDEFFNYDKASKRDLLKNKKFDGNEHISDEYTNKPLAKAHTDVDHIIPLKEGVKEYGKSKFLTDKEIREALNNEINYAYTDAGVNRSKNDETNSKAVQNKNKKVSQLDDESKQRMINKEKEAKPVVEKELNSAVATNLKEDIKNVTQGQSQLVNDAKDQAIKDGTQKAIGEVVILLIKPLYYEFNDIFKNGMIGNLNVNDKIEAFIYRMKRVKDYVLNNAVGTFFDNLKDLLQGFVTMLINGIVNAFVGLLKKILQVISEGFTAIIEAIKILSKDNDNDGNPITPAQKADAIVKLLATTAVTFLGAYFEESILGFMKEPPLEFFKDIIMVMFTGIASTVIVWLIDQADLFSVKSEKRLIRVKEIFELRIEAIKKNTDIFEKASIEVLAKQKLQFKKIASNMHHAIENNLNVNDSVYEMANFMHIDLQAKSTDEFLALLATKKQLVI